MKARAHVEYAPLHDAVKVTVAHGISGDARSYVDFSGVTFYNTVHDGAALPDIDPALYLPEDVARALYESLSHYFGGAPDMATVRADLLHERGRVDQMLTYLMSRPAK